MSIFHIPTSPAEMRRPDTRITDAETDLLADDVVKGNVVLILGHEALLDTSAASGLAQYGGSMEMFMRDYFVQYARSTRRVTLDPAGTLDSFQGSGLNVKEIVHEMVMGSGDPLTNPTFDTSFINPDIRALLETGHIRVVLTTDYDPLLEKVMRGIWGDSLEVRNYYSDAKDIFDLSKIVLNEDVPPTLYYLFGKAGETRRGKMLDFVVTEDDRINLVTRWVRNPPANLTRFIADKRLMAIGCKFDDWLFRFFWYGVLGRRLERDPQSLLSISFTDSDSDVKLREYLGKKQLSLLDNVNGLLDSLNARIPEAWMRLVTERRRRGGVFLSYCSEDRDAALSLFYRLLELDVPVWFDSESLHSGDTYSTVISQAIKNCTVFLPVLSGKMASHPECADPDNEDAPGFKYYRDKEWRLAQDRYDKEEKLGTFHIVPFCLPDYNPRRNPFPPSYTVKYANIFNKTAAYYDKASLSDVISTVKKHLLLP